MKEANAVEGTVFEVQLPEAPPNKIEQERRAFYRLWPGLLVTHAGLYVAIHEEQVVDSGLDQIEVALRVQRRIGALPIFVHRVANEQDPLTTADFDFSTCDLRSCRDRAVRRLRSLCAQMGMVLIA